MKEINSYELSEFNLKKDEQINLDEKCGLVKIVRSEDHRLILVTDGEYDLIYSDTPKPLKFANVDSALGFVLDIGIRKEKKLTYGHGFYFGTQLIAKSQSEKEISQADFDGDLLEKIVSEIDSKFHSADPAEAAWGVKMRNLLDTYNNARLMFPNFHNDSYLSLMRILDALGKGKGRFSFALWIASMSPTLNQEIFAKIPAPAQLVAEEVFNECLAAAQSIKDKSLKQARVAPMEALDQASRLIFACFYSSYQYRNMYVHQGLPFPYNINGHELDYLGLSLGSSYPKFIRKDGIKPDDLIDFHDVIDTSEEEVLKFKEKYFQLIPTWHFMKTMTRQALLDEINTL